MQHAVTPDRFATDGRYRTGVLRASDLRGRAVVDVDSASKLGEIDDVLLDVGGRRLAALLVSKGPTILGGGQHSAVPAEAIFAIGPDAVTVRGSAIRSVVPGESATRLSQITGRKVVTESGRYLGTFSDALLDPSGQHLAGFPLAPPSAAGGLDGLFGTRRESSQYVAADADLRFGPDMVVVPDEAVQDTVPGRDGADGVPISGSPVAATPSRSAATAPPRPAEPLAASGSAHPVDDERTEVITQPVAGWQPADSRGAPGAGPHAS